MKKVTIFLCFLFISFYSISQIRAGLIVGGLLANNTRPDNRQNLNGETWNYSYGALPSFSAGIVSNLPMGKLLSLRPEIIYIRKGSKIDGTNNSASWINKISINYVEIPFNVVFNAPTRTGKFYIGAGPYLAYGLSGKLIYGQTGQKVKLGVGSSNPATIQVNRWDYGVTSLAGYELKNGFFLNAHYSLGLNNVFPKDPEANKNTTLGLSIGKLFSFRKL